MPRKLKKKTLLFDGQILLGVFASFFIFETRQGGGRGDGGE